MTEAHARKDLNMLSNITKKIELTANLAIVVVACLLAIVLVKNHLLNGPSEGVKSSKAQSDGQLVNGNRLSLLDVDWKQSKQTLLLAVSSTCHFCTESAPFYRQLAQSHEGTQLIVVVPQSVDEGRRYLSKLGLQVDNVVQAPLNSINVSGTPTLMLVNRDGAVIGTWVGKLPAEREAEVLSDLKAGRD
jgi:hypothetical protein